MRRSHDHVALVLRRCAGGLPGGGYEELSGTPHQPDWVVGVSTGTINAAISADNPPHRRVERLNAFWQLVSSGLLQFSDPTTIMPWLRALTENGQERRALNQSSASRAAMLGIPGFFQPRLPPPPFQPRGTAGALRLCDTSPLAARWKA